MRHQPVPAIPDFQPCPQLVHDWDNISPSRSHRLRGSLRSGYQEFLIGGYVREAEQGWRPDR